jgi:hypothetical protein
MSQYKSKPEIISFAARNVIKLVWLYTGGKGQALSVLAGGKLNTSSLINLQVTLLITKKGDFINYKERRF